MQYKCPKCHTEYYEGGECDWCPGVERTMLAVPEQCQGALERVLAYVRKLEVKAAKWDAVVMACHRMGGKCAEVIRAVNERIKG